MNEDIYNTLYYYQEQGEEGYDLGEVMLLEHINDDERLKKLIELLNNEDKYIAYQAILILISWNIKEGFDKFNQFYSERWDKSEKFEPHRIYGYDNVYDVFADAFTNSLIKGNSEFELVPFIKKLLLIYHEVFFESNLKELLLSKSSFSLLIADIENAVLKCIEEGIYYQGSQLFPVMVKFDKKKYDSYKNIFFYQITNDSRIKFNLEEAVEYLK